jgi:hypothetical protein
LIGRREVWRQDHFTLLLSLILSKKNPPLILLTHNFIFKRNIIFVRVGKNKNKIENRRKKKDKRGRNDRMLKERK